MASYVAPMMNDRKLSGSSIDGHEPIFRAALPDARKRLEAIQAVVEQRVTNAERCVSYGMPAFRRGKVFLYFAAFKKHIGVYPPVNAPETLIDELKIYRGPKGNLIFPHDKSLPIALIGRIAEALVDQYAPDTQR
jgi:uncharacterized protein YdhG (YjbR/CyaY superfamily)